MEFETKEKLKKVFKGIYVGITTVLSIGFITCLAVGCSQTKKSNNKVQVACAESEKLEIKQDTRKYVSYDDEEYDIYLNLNELNTYTFYNFFDWVSNWEHLLSQISFVYNTISYTYDSYGDGAYMLTPSNQTTPIYLIDDSTEFNTNYGTSGFLNYQFAYGDNINSFSYDLTIQLVNVNTYYDDVKQAIELDIQANTQTINDGIFETLTDSTVGFIGTISSGISSMFAVFYDSANSNLTTIGLLSVIVVSISLAYFLFRLIIGLIRMRG